MENPILDFTDTLAKYSDEGEFRARIAATINAARMSWARLDVAASCGDDDDDDDDELVESAPQPAAPPSPADGLKTRTQAARRLGVSIRTLRGLVSSGELRYVNVGRGKQREKMMFTDNDLDDLIAGRTRQKAQQCPSTSPKVRRSTTSISGGEVIAFTARRSGQTGGKRKR
jgi:excisionase family DNA binding protein